MCAIISPGDTISWFFSISQDKFFINALKTFICLVWHVLYALIDALRLTKSSNWKKITFETFWKILNFRFKNSIPTLHDLFRTKLRLSGRFRYTVIARRSNLCWLYFWVTKVFATCVRLKIFEKLNYKKINFLVYGKMLLFTTNNILFTNNILLMQFSLLMELHENVWFACFFKWKLYDKHFWSARVICTFCATCTATSYSCYYLHLVHKTPPNLIFQNFSMKYI